MAAGKIVSGIVAAALTVGAGKQQGPAPAPSIKVSDRTVHVGQVIEFSATGLDPAGGCFIMLCQNQPSFFAICARPGNIADSFVHLEQPGQRGAQDQ